MIYFPKISQTIPNFVRTLVVTKKINDHKTYLVTSNASDMIINNILRKNSLPGSGRRSCQITITTWLWSEMILKMLYTIQSNFRTFPSREKVKPFNKLQTFNCRLKYSHTVEVDTAIFCDVAILKNVEFLQFTHDLKHLDTEKKNRQTTSTNIINRIWYFAWWKKDMEKLAVTLCNDYLYELGWF